MESAVISKDSGLRVLFGVLILGEMGSTRGIYHTYVLGGESGRMFSKPISGELVFSHPLIIRLMIRRLNACI